MKHGNFRKFCESLDPSLEREPGRRGAESWENETEADEKWVYGGGGGGGGQSKGDKR